MRVSRPIRALIACVALALGLVCRLAPDFASLQVRTAAAAEAASEIVDRGNARAQLLGETVAAVPGEVLWLGFRLDLSPGWHSYWQNPGDSGTAPVLTWNLPAGVSAGEIRWPAPTRIPVGPLMNYGYSGTVLFPVPLAVSPALAESPALAIEVLAEWLVCREICIPQQATLRLSLPVAGAGTPSPWKGEFDRARADLPVPLAGAAQFRRAGDSWRLIFDMAAFERDKIRDVWFFPLSYGVIDYAAPQAVRLGADAIGIEMRAGPSAAQPEYLPDRLAGVLALADNAYAPRWRRAYSLSASPATDAPGFDTRWRNLVPLATVSAVRPETGGGLRAFAVAVVLALLGGLILNLMPCVFPVISIKAIALAGKAHEARAEVRRHSAVVALGVLVAFAVISVSLILLRRAGAEIGWGFQLQSPRIVAALAAVMALVGLMLSGIVNFGFALAGLGQALTQRGGYAGSFFTGVLCAVVATPCTAPFMAAALAYALTQPPGVAFVVFESLGLGLAAPYLALAIWPGVFGFLPRPGRWMETAKQAAAFPMYGAAAWLLWVLGRQAGTDAIAATLAAIVLFAFASWVHARWRDGGVGIRNAARIAAALAVLAGAAALWWVSAPAAPPVAEADRAGERVVWREYSAEDLAALRAKGTPVLLNVTAAWCITCLVNERIALSSPAVARALAAKNVVPVKADWTKQDPQIARLLAEFGRNGVPLYALYPKGGGDPVVLAQLLTETAVLAALDKL